MADLVFYEKPGCVGNNRQKVILRKLGISLQVHDILCETWTPENLRPFFADKVVSSWFNESAPRVKNGQIDICKLSETDALFLMLEQPILIKRPLMVYQTQMQSGFTSGPVFDLLGISFNDAQNVDGCPMLRPMTEPSSEAIL